METDRPDLNALSLSDLKAYVNAHGIKANKTSVSKLRQSIRLHWFGPADAVRRPRVIKMPALSFQPGLLFRRLVFWSLQPSLLFRRLMFWPTIRLHQFRRRRPHHPWTKALHPPPPPPPSLNVPWAASVSYLGLVRDDIDVTRVVRPYTPFVGRRIMSMVRPMYGVQRTTRLLLMRAFWMQWNCLIMMT